MRCRLMVFLLILVPCLLAGPLSPSAQPPAKMARIGYLSPTSGLQPAGAAFQQGLRDLGWMEGQNITVEYRWAAGQVEQLAALAVELAQLPVEVIVTVGAATAAAQRATPTIPIVFVGVGDPVASGLVRSLAQPGGNITGIANWNDVLMGKRLELLKEIVPGLSRVVALWYKAQATSGMPRALRELEQAAGALALPLHIVEVQGLQALEEVGSALTTTQADALMVVPSALFFQQRTRLVEFMAQHRLPAMYEGREFVEAGGPYRVWPVPACAVAARRPLCGQDPQRHQTRRSAGGAAHAVRVGDQSEDCQGARDHDTPDPPMSGRRGDPIGVRSKPGEGTNDARALPNKAVEPTAPMVTLWHAGAVHGAAAHRRRSASSFQIVCQRRLVESG